jgi:catechol 2,3-dioxygenase
MTPSLQIQSVDLRVGDLPRSVDFYTRQVGFVVHAEERNRVALATSADAPPLLTLAFDPAAKPAPADAAGLFHAALLLPDAAALGGWLRLAASHSVEFDGFSDHGVSEAIYFSDPDGNGLEFYADRPRAEWPFQDGELAMITRPLALPHLLAHANSVETEPLAGAQWGHVHLRVTDLDRSEAFYREALGLEVMQRSFPGARFLAADGYHHHVGLNVWGNPRRAQPARAPGLAHFTVARAGEHTARELMDPDRMALSVVPLAVPAPK